MAMQISGNYGLFQTGCAERVKEKQAVEGTEEKAKEAENAEVESKAADVKAAGKLPERRDTYVRSADSGTKGANDGQEEPETCTGNTDAVEREIRKLREKKQELEQQIRSASGDETKIRDLEKKLAQVEQELSRKDNDAYKKQHTVFSGMM